MTEFWEQLFKNNQALLGLEPSPATVLTHAFFVEHNVKNVLIPGIGYGRNAQIFRSNIFPLNLRFPLSTSSALIN